MKDITKIIYEINNEFKKALPFVIDSFTNVYGEEYRDIISKKINNSMIIPYLNIGGLDIYISYIKSCKRREYSIKFLDKIGVDVKQYETGNYSKELNVELENILEYYIGFSHLGFGEDSDYFVPLQAFKPNNSTPAKKLLKNKIKIINYLLDNKEKIITEENINEFTKTEEYKKVLKKIDDLNKIYEPLLSESIKWEEKFKPYQELIKYEKEKKEKIFKEKKEEMFTKIYSWLTPAVKSIIDNKPIEEQINIILGNDNINYKTLIESFSDENLKKLNNKNISLFQKYLIIDSQTKYLKNLGINIPDKKTLECESEEDINKCLDFLNQESLKKYIPNDIQITYIKLVRDRICKEATKKYYNTRKDLMDIKKIFENDENSLNISYDIITNNKVCIISGYSYKQFISIMFYTIRFLEGGSLFFSFMHECGHIIDQSEKGSGFELSSIINETNPYDNKFRKYEKFNETLNDIFTVEAVNLLHNQNIYLIEPKEYTSLDANNLNTASITKDILKPLVSKFREQVISAKINQNPEELIQYIGKDNFEELVDVVNKVDFLARQGIEYTIKTDKDNEMVKDYFNQLERTKNIYNNIDCYYNNYIKNLKIKRYK